MKLVSALILIAGFCCATKAEIPILGTVIGTVTNVSREVINTAVDGVEEGVNLVGKGFGLMGQGVGYLGHDTYNFISDKIEVALEKLKELMLDEIELLGLPRLEPFSIDHIDVDLDHEIGVFKGSIDNVKIVGLSKFHTKDVAFSGTLLRPHVEINVTFDKLDASGDYDINANIGDILNVFGKGPFTFTIFNVFGGVDVLLKVKDNHFYIEDMHLLLKLERMECHFKNLMGGGENEEIFNRVIAQLVPEALENLWPEIEPVLVEKLKEDGNKRLEKLTSQDIVNIILGQKSDA